MDIGSIVQLLLAAAIGAIVYGLIARALPGRQPGEDVIDKVFAKFDKTASEAAAKLQEAATKQAAAATILGRAATQVAQAAAGQAASGEAIAPSVAPTPTAAPIAPVASIPAADVPGMTAAERAATRPATDLDMAAATPTVGGSTWPQTVILADGTRMLAKAPVSPLYRTSLLGTLMGKPIPGGGGHAADPANGDEVNPPLPLRSPAGFPIRYSIAGGAVVGTPTILWGDHSFNSDAEVLDFIRRTMRTAEQEAAAAAAWAAAQERLKERAAVTAAEAAQAPGFPPWHASNPANVGKQAIWGGSPGTWGAAREGDAASLGNTGGNEHFYDNVTGNPAWAHPDNPPYRWDGARWVRP